MNLPLFSVKRKVTTVMLIGIVIVFGIISFFYLGLDLLPEMDVPIAAIVTTYEGTGPKEMEDLVTRHIEMVASTIKHVKKVKSSTKEGMSTVIVEFEWGVNIDFAAQDIREKIALVKDFLPDDCETPMVVKFDPGAIPIMVIAVTGLRNTRELYNYLDNNLINRIKRLDGVASCAMMGGMKKEIKILIDLEKIKSKNISMSQIINAVQMHNVNISAGHVKKGYKEYLLRILGEYKTINEIRETVIIENQAGTIKLKDIAQIRNSQKEIRNYGRTNLNDSIILAIMKQSGTNTAMVSEKVKTALKKISKDFPESIKFHAIIDMGEIIGDVTTATAKTAWTGAILAILVLYFFLRDWRPTLTIGLAIPLSIICTFIGMYLIGYTFNLITLGGLALGVGMLVDNAVVVIESIFRHIQEGADRVKAAVNGANEVAAAITTSTITTIAVFIPMIMSSSVAGKLSRNIAMTICIALSASLFVALTLIPMLAATIFQENTSKKDRFRYIKIIYQKYLKIALNNQWKVIFFSIFLFILSIFIAGFLGAEFMPKTDTPMLMMMFKLPTGTNLPETNRVLQKIEKNIMNIKDVKFVTCFIGLSDTNKMDAAAGWGASGINEAQIFIKLPKKDFRSKSDADIADEIRQIIPDIKGSKMEFIDMGDATMNIGDEQKPIVIKIFGKELDRLKNLADIIKTKISNIKGLRDLDTTLDSGKPEIKIKPAKDIIEKFGLNSAILGDFIKTARMGKIVGRFRKHGEQIDIRLKLKDKYTSQFEKLKKLKIMTPAGEYIDLMQIITIEKTTGPIKITKEDQENKISVTANIYGRDLGSVVKDIKKELLKIQMPSGYFLEFGGQYEEMISAFKTMTAALFLAILLVYMVMASQFESFIHPFIIMLCLPLAFIGVVSGLLIMQMKISVPSFMGTIILCGIVVNNGIVLIDYINQLKAKGIKKTRAILEAASTRLRPILITATTTVFGMLPIGLSTSQGSELRGPLGISIVGGLIASTFLTLIIIPIMYKILDRDN